MKRELGGHQRELAPPSEVDEETRQAMAALGYLGSGGGVTSGPLPDPKSQLPALAKLRDGFQQMHEKRWPDAERTFRGLVESNPQMVDAWEFLGKSLLKQGQPEAALAAYQTALERSGGASHIAVQVASILFGMERLDDAAAHARLAINGSPSIAHGLLARIALRRKDLDTAEREARAALEDRDERVLPLVVLAEVLFARQQYDQALDAVKRAREAYAARDVPDPDLLVGLSLVEGKVHADLGDAAAAERAFAEEIRLFPENISAYSNLALVYALTGRGVEATQELRRMTEAVPTAAAYAEAARTYRALGDERGAQAVIRYARRKFPESELLKQLERAA
jgi:tetratricopeptide (TPR) repeat protein